MRAFEYDLPPACIAQVPAEPRDSARLLVDRGATTAPDHRLVADLPDLLEAGDVLVVNDTRVIPARLRVRRATGGNVEVFLVRPLEGGGWHALVRPARRLGVGEVLRSVHPAGDEFAVEIG
jgi:S-adenosylmethionine:tRNA ribosyltransferase-isomerase